MLALENEIEAIKHIVTGNTPGLRHVAKKDAGNIGGPQFLEECMA